MKTKRFPPANRSGWRWLALAGVLTTLTVPLTARAEHDGNGAMEVLVSTAVAYAVIDAAGGFDDRRHDHRRDVHYRDHRHDRYRHDRYHHDRYRHDRYRYDRHHWRERDHRHYGWRMDSHKRWSHDKGRKDNRRDWKGHHPGRGDDRNRIRAFH